MSDTSPPNILVLCTDQQRYDALGCYGNRASPDEQRTVECKGDYRGPSHLGQPKHLVARFGPAKVFMPPLISGVEQRYPLTGHWVTSTDSISLMKIALAACQPEVCVFCGTAERLGYEMIDH
jgi:hypothetical protein